MRMLTINGVRHLLVPVPDEKLHDTEWERCAEFLRSMLNETALPATKAQQAAEQAGFKPATIKKTKEKIGIRSHYSGKPHKAGIWWWMPPR